MTEITAAMVKELRERTGGGMMECKKALVEANGDMTAAADILVQKGEGKAAKSATRVAAQGRISIATAPNAAAMTEVNCETDFVARDENFIPFCQQVTDIALKEGISENDKLFAASYDTGVTVEDARKSLISRIGENIQIRRVHYAKANANERIGSYIHQGRIGVLITIEGGNDALAKDLAMHIAAMKPQYLTAQSVPEAIVNKEKEILLERVKESGKPESVLEKIVSGQLQKYLNEICLEGQPFFKDPDQTIAAVVNAANAKLVEIGEGIEVIKTSFEDEVKAVAGSSKP
jgi:elongation factor Ts